jgi:hypothetical protein
MIELKANEVKTLNVALTPIAVPTQIAIDQMFIGTSLKSAGSNTAIDGLYIRIKNNGAASVSGTLNIYDWQAWWGQAPGDDRLWGHPTFTIAPQETFSYQCTWNHLVSDTTYVRAEVVVNGVIITQSPCIYIIPGKRSTATEWIAEGACTYTERGLVVLWYSQSKSACNMWEGYYQTPATRPYLHECTFDFETYDGKPWYAVFLAMIDPGFISGAQYEAYVSGGAGGTGWKDVWFNFTPA